MGFIGSLASVLFLIVVSSPRTRAARAAGALLLAACRTPDGEIERPWLDAARETARWLEYAALETEAGLAWPAVPEESGEPDRTLYAGSPGVVLFFLELAGTTDQESAVQVARAGADELLLQLPERVEGESAGLYTGVAGVGFTLGETWRATGDERYRAGLERCVEVLVGAAPRDRDGAAWTSVNDVVSGTAGIGFFLMYAADVLGSDRAGQQALAAARMLCSRAEATEHGLDWPMEPDFPRRMPNFSHGTAGIAAFLARDPGRGGSVEHALRGAEHLLAIADRSGEGFRVFHHTPDGTDLFYYGWCHGPCGTARLFRELALATEDERWRELELACARSVMESGLPEQRLPGLWDNVSRCCGSAGVIEFMLALHAETGERRYLEFARRVARDIVARGTRDEHGLCWIQAEHRVKPELLQAQTGLMQGAAGIALALLHLDAAERGRTPLVTLPDEP